MNEREVLHSIKTLNTGSEISRLSCTDPTTHQAVEMGDFVLDFDINVLRDV